jgi:hypothetical protein
MARDRARRQAVPDDRPGSGTIGDGQCPASGFRSRRCGFERLEAVLVRQRARPEAIGKAAGQIMPSVVHRGGHPVRWFRGLWLTAGQAAGLAMTAK